MQFQRSMEESNISLFTGSHSRGKGRRYITQTEAAKWVARKCPTGDNERSWIAIASAAREYLFKPSEIRALIRRRTLRSKVGTNGPMRGVTYVLRHEIGRLRQAIGFTEKEAANDDRMEAAA